MSNHKPVIDLLQSQRCETLMSNFPLTLSRLVRLRGIIRNYTTSKRMTGFSGVSGGEVCVTRHYAFSCQSLIINPLLTCSNYSGVKRRCRISRKCFLEWCAHWEIGIYATSRIRMALFSEVAGGEVCVTRHCAFSCRI